MNKQKLIEKYEEKHETIFGFPVIQLNQILEDLKQLDEPQPIKLKDIIARMEGLSGYTRSEWLDEILYKFDSDYGTLKYKDGYEQGKLEASMIPYEEPQKVVVPQFVADLIEEARTYEWDLDDLFEHISECSGDSEVSIWFYTLGNVDVLARAWLDGYTVEEKRYTVKIKAILGQYLERYYLNNEELTPQFKRTQLKERDELPTFTRTELEQAGFGWVFKCPGIEFEEVEE